MGAHDTFVMPRFEPNALPQRRARPILAVTGSAAEWPADYDAALGKAHAENRVLLIYFRSCGVCNRPTDGALKEAEKHEPITAMYESFVRMRVNDGAVVHAHWRN